jgi:predicted ATP-dependent endonuclease of OLD family
MIKVFIGPNGYGKTTKLESIKQNLINSGVNVNEILFLESEILLLEEVKDTKDNTKTMEYILTELLETVPVITSRTNYEQAIDTEITSNIANVNTIIDDILSLNGMTRTGDFISVSTTKTYKNLVKINQNDVKKKMGSGQRMHLLLELVNKSSKQYLFIDEPEKYSHPSMLNKTANLLNVLSLTKDIYIATHSPKLLSMLDLELDNISILNDTTYSEKNLDFIGSIGSYTTHGTLLSANPGTAKSSSYFNVINLKDNIKRLHYRDFMEALFANTVYLVEVVNDELFIKKMLLDNGKYYGDYYIFPVYGKHHMMIFTYILSGLSIKVKLFFDEDNTNPINTSTNTLLSGFDHFMFSPNIEDIFHFPRGSKYNTVAFLDLLDLLTIPATYDI